MIKVEKCKTKAAYSAKVKVDLNKVKKNFEVILETPILVVIKVDGVEVVVHSYGELLFKKCDDIELMQRIAEKISGSK